MVQYNVNYGCGLSAAAGWLNYDASPTLRLSKLPVIGRWAKRKTPFPPDVRFGNVTKRLPLDDGSAARVYSSHVLEHLTLAECRQALRETYRIMAPGAVFRGVMPDLRAEVAAYTEDPSDEACHRFMRRSGLGVEERDRGVFSAVSNLFGNSAHLWLWDYNAIRAALADAGFKNCRRARFGDHNDAKFGAVEQESRWSGCLGFSCEK